MRFGQTRRNLILTRHQPVHRCSETILIAATRQQFRTPWGHTAVSDAIPRWVVSLEAGVRIRATIIATTRFRITDAFRSISRSSPHWRRVTSLAATWPCGSVRVMSKESVMKLKTAGATLSRARNPSTRSGSHWLRLARVHVLTFPVSREDSHSRMAGGDERLGMISTNRDMHRQYRNRSHPSQQRPKPIF